MIYDANMKQTLVFGGSHNGQDMGDLWAWNSTSWKMLAETGPAPRIGFVLAYNKKRKETMLFGVGQGPGPLIFSCFVILVKDW